MKRESQRRSGRRPLKGKNKLNSSRPESTQKSQNQFELQELEMEEEGEEEEDEIGGIQKENKEENKEPNNI